ncbi:MAG: ribose 1,5-bisphosphate isomerase [Candidatus Altiarchaeales archaeon]|nr:MAG: ribose 1,5-bisphosphate isomerase [Candidatus Altiarchaeales archaeon]
MTDIVDRTYRDIKSMRVRGALNIAISASRTLREVITSDAKNTPQLLKKLKRAGKKLKSARPTAISLPNAINYILYIADKNSHLELDEFRKKLLVDIDKFIDEQKSALDRIAEIGSNLIKKKDIILTHCNSDTVDTLIKRAWDDGKKIEVVCTETRPRYQGHITARELSSYGIPTTLIVDSAAHLIMKELDIDKVIVGADTIYASGDMINKIGTSQIALCAKELDIDFIVAAESIKFSPLSLLGSMVEIEERDPSEVIKPGKLPRVKILNPAFDITSADYIDVFATEFGVIPPEAVYSLLRERFGWELEI